MSKVCIKCGTTLEDSALFCDECGTRQPNTQSPQQPFQQSSYGQATSGNWQPKSTEQNEGTLRNSGVGIASFVLGIIAICTLGSLVIPEIIGIICSIISLNAKNTKKGFPIAGLIMCVASLLWFVFVIFISVLYGI